MKVNTDHSTSPMNHGTARQRTAHGYTKAFDECGAAMATLGPYMDSPFSKHPLALASVSTAHVYAASNRCTLGGAWP